jgi:hypothetical protein
MPPLLAAVVASIRGGNSGGAKVLALLRSWLRTSGCEPQSGPNKAVVECMVQWMWCMHISMHSALRAALRCIPRSMHGAPDCGTGLRVRQPTPVVLACMSSALGCWLMGNKCSLEVTCARSLCFSTGA